MFVYVIRHGESETNLSKKWTGWLDVQLTEKGYEDAKKAACFLKGITFDKIYTSDLKRAIQTAQTAFPGCLYETSPLFREINVGSISNQPFSVVTDDQRKYAAEFGYIEFDGESKEQFYSRIKQAMGELEKQDCKNVAVFSHGGFLRGMLDTVVGTYLPRGTICCDNCTIAIFEYLNEGWKLHSWINPL